jgi:hypothetical protein
VCAVVSKDGYFVWSLVFFVLSSMNSHPVSAAYYENGRKGNKEDIAFITLAGSHGTSENLAKLPQLCPMSRLLSKAFKRRTDTDTVVLPFC